MTDLAGRTVGLRQPATRIVSLVPSATLTLAAIGGRDLLVGRTDFDTAAWVSDVPSVGGGINPSYESLTALHPDLVIRFSGTQDPRTPGVLDRIGIPHIAVRHDGVSDVLDVITLIGDVSGMRLAAGDVRRSIERTLADVRAEAATHAPLRGVYVLGGTPAMVAGPRSFIHEILEVAGVTNAFQDLERSYARVSPEEFVVRGIDVFLARDAADVPGWMARGIPVIALGGLLETPGPGLGESARVLERRLHHR